MRRSTQRARIRSARTTKLARPGGPQKPAILPRLRQADRKSLLLSTALASTLLLLPVITATPASAQVTFCPGGNAPIDISATQPIVCNNANDRTNNDGRAINLLTDTNPGAFIVLNNSGDLEAFDDNAGVAGIYVETRAANSDVFIDNRGAITVYSQATTFAAVSASWLRAMEPTAA